METKKKYPTKTRPFDPNEEYGFLSPQYLDCVKPKHQRYWMCMCRCGTTKSIREYHLVTGLVVSCGCFRREVHSTHGMYRSIEYTCWDSMIQRCTNPNHDSYENYGGRGINVCERWMGSFEAFYKDMGPRKSRKYSLERLDVDKGYEPGNVIWATSREQGRNKRTNRMLTMNGETKTLMDWSRQYDIPYTTLTKRLKRMTLEDAIKPRYD